MNDKHTVLEAIKKQGMLPLFYYEDAEVSYHIVQTLYKAGVRAIEYTNRGPAALENFKYLKAHAEKEWPGLALGIGTIKTEADAQAFIAAGADFMVSPIVAPGVAKWANKAGLLWVPGCMTPTEIDAAQQDAALLIKLFPAHLLQPSFVSAVLELFPGQMFMPTGGIELEKTALKAWFRAGVCAVGMGSKLISKAVLNERRYEELHRQTEAALAVVKEAKDDHGFKD